MTDDAKGERERRVQSAEKSAADWLPNVDAVWSRFFGRGSTQPDLTIGFTGAELNRARDLLQAALAPAQAQPDRDADWILAIGHALGMDSGYMVPIVPEVQPFRDLFAAIRKDAQAQRSTWRAAAVIEGLSYQQCDDDGVMCITSRQAVEEARELLAMLVPDAQAQRVEPECEKCFGSGWVRGVELDDPSPETMADRDTNYPCDVDFGASHFARILLALRDHGPMTVNEIAAECAFGEQQVNKRLPEMQRAKLAAVLLDANGREVTRKGASGRHQRVWRAV